MSKLRKKKISFIARLRNYFITGIVVLVPIGITLYLTTFFISISSKLIPQGINPNSYLPFAIPGLEILLSVIFITLIGGLSLSFIGKKVLQLFNDLLKKYNLADPIQHEDLFNIAEKEIKKIEKNNTKMNKFNKLIKLYDKVAVINETI